MPCFGKDLLICYCIRVLCATNSLGHIESKPGFNVLSKRLEIPGSNPQPPFYKASNFTTTPWYLLIIHLYKRKGNPQVCDNHRGISLLSIAGKILAKFLLNRLNAHLDQAGLIPESQCGFRKDRGTIDMIFTARQLQEKCQEQNVDLYMTFVDLTKAFDTVSPSVMQHIVSVESSSLLLHSYLI